MHWTYRTTLNQLAHPYVLIILAWSQIFYPQMFTICRNEYPNPSSCMIHPYLVFTLHFEHVSSFGSHHQLQHSHHKSVYYFGTDATLQSFLWLYSPLEESTLVFIDWQLFYGSWSCCKWMSKIVTWDLPDLEAYPYFHRFSSQTWCSLYCWKFQLGIESGRP